MIDSARKSDSDSSDVLSSILGKSIPSATVKRSSTDKVTYTYLQPAKNKYLLDKDSKGELSLVGIDKKLLIGRNIVPSVGEGRTAEIRKGYDEVQEVSGMKRRWRPIGDVRPPDISDVSAVKIVSDPGDAGAEQQTKKKSKREKKTKKAKKKSKKESS